MAKWFTSRRRRWFYRVGAAVLLLLAGYGVVSESAVGLWLGLLGAVVGLETAARHVPEDE